MVLLHNCCCWNDLKVASVASAMFSLVTSLAEVVLMFALFSGEYELVGTEIFHTAHRVFYLLFFILAVLNIIIVLLSSILLASIELDTKGLKMMLPWLMASPVQLSYEAIVCSYFFYSALLARTTDHPVVTSVFSYLLAAIIYWVVKFFLNIFAHITVLSYYQQLSKQKNYQLLRNDKRFLKAVYKPVAGTFPSRAASVDQHPCRLPFVDEKAAWQARGQPLYSTPRGNLNKSCVKEGLPEDSIDWSHPWGVTTISEASAQQDTRKLNSFGVGNACGALDSRNNDVYGIMNNSKLSGFGVVDSRKMNYCGGRDISSFQPTRLCQTFTAEGSRRLPRTRLTEGQRGAMGGGARIPASGADYASVFRYGYPTAYNGRQFSIRSSVN